MTFARALPLPCSCAYFYNSLRTKLYILTCLFYNVLVLSFCSRSICFEYLSNLTFWYLWYEIKSTFWALIVISFEEKKYRFQHFKGSKMNNIMKVSQQNAVCITKRSVIERKNIHLAPLFQDLTLLLPPCRSPSWSTQGFQHFN